MPRTRNPAATKARILEAAAQEFADHGLSGARYERIADHASANKERIYAYFGDKEQLFAAVLEDHMPAFAEAHGMTDPLGIADHIGELFDFHAQNPNLTRLLLWEALHYGFDEVPSSVVRADHYRGRRDIVATALGDASALDPGHLSFALTSLVAWWFAAPQLARFHVDGDIQSPEVHARQRSFVVETATRLLAPVEDGVTDHQGRSKN